MNDRIRHIIGRTIEIAIFTVACLLVLGLVYRVVSWKDTEGDYLSTTSQLYSTPRNTVDAVFLGSSHCYCSIYPVHLWRSAGVAAFDMAVSGQDRDSTCHMLREVLKTQKPKVVCVDMYGLLFDENKVQGNVYRNMLSMKTNRNSIELIRDYVDPEEQKDYIIKWPILHTRYRELDKYDFVQYEPSVYGRGGFYQWAGWQGTVDLGNAANEECEELSQDNLEWLEELFQISRQNEFSLIFYVAPFCVTAENQQTINSAARFAAEHGIEFIDVNKRWQEFGIDCSTDFMDGYHCNDGGATKISNYFAGLLTSKYGLQDRRGETDYDYWDMDARWYDCQKLDWQLKNTEDPAEYIQLLRQSSDIVAVFSLEAQFDERGDYYYDLLEEAGILREECALGGKWIYRDSVITRIMPNDETAGCYVTDLSRYDTLRVSYQGMLNPANVMINMDCYGQQFYNLTILTYDTYLEQPVETRGF